MTTHGPFRASAELLIREVQGECTVCSQLWRVRKSVEWPSLPPEMMPSQMSEPPAIPSGQGLFVREKIKKMAEC